MNPNEIKQIIDAVCSTDIKKFKYANNGIKIEIDRNEGVANTVVMAPVAGTSAGMVAQTAKAPVVSNEVAPVVETAVPATVAETAPAPKVVDQNAVTIPSPIVGVFYGSPTPESDAYVSVGQTVKKGAILCIVEAMKVMNEITAEYDMKILEVLTSNEQLVEYGQPLFSVERL